MREYGREKKVPILTLLRNPNPDVQTLAQFVYDKVFYGYTLKQWSCTPEELDSEVTGRVPVHISRDNRYFQDVHQAVPRDGYSRLFDRMINHPNIQVLVDTPFASAEGLLHFNHLIYTGPLDELFGGHGELPYRSLRFELNTVEQEWVQEVGTINYPNDNAFIRVTELKHLSGQKLPFSTLIREYPRPHVPGHTEPYYPIPRADNHRTYDLYLKEAKKHKRNMILAGRLADYKYYNMDDAVARALKLFRDCVIPISTGASYA